MKYSIASAALLVATVAAQPHGHAHLHQARDVTKTETTWVTETEYVTEIVDSTTTMWVTPGHAAATTSSVAAPVEPSKAQQFFEPPSSVPAAPTSVAAPTQQQVQAPPANTPPPAAPAAPTTSVAAPPPVQQQAPPAAQSSAPKSGGQEYTGDLTYYALGMGACGFDDSGKDQTENVVAMSSQIMGAQSNGNPMCGKTITITNGSKSIQGTIRDKCPSCPSGSIDVSEHAFLALFGDLGVGRGKVTWSFN